MITRQLYIIFIFITASSFGQDSIFKADGTRTAINGESVKIDLRLKLLTFAPKGEAVAQQLALKNLEKMTYQGKRFEMLKVGNKQKPFFVIARHDGLTLATLTKEIVTSTGGFNVRYVNHEMLVLEGSKVIERISFTENNDDKNIKKRIKAKAQLELYFGDCVEVMERLAYFANTPNNSLIEGDIASFLKQSPYLLCP